MKKFKFRFQTILDIRVRDLEKAELLVAEAQHKVLEAKQKLENLRIEHKKNQTFFKKNPWRRKYDRYTDDKQYSKLSGSTG